MERVVFEIPTKVNGGTTDKGTGLSERGVELLKFNPQKKDIILEIENGVCDWKIAEARIKFLCKGNLHKEQEMVNFYSKFFNVEVEPDSLAKEMKARKVAQERARYKKICAAHKKERMAYDKKRKAIEDKKEEKKLMKKIKKIEDSRAKHGDENKVIGLQKKNNSKSVSVDLRELQRSSQTFEDFMKILKK